MHDIDDSLADLLFELEPQSAAGLASATNRTIPAVIAEMRQRTMTFEPVAGDGCWWWKLTDEARRDHQRDQSADGGKRARRRSREPAGGGAAPADPRTAPAPGPSPRPADGDAPAGQRGDAGGPDRAPDRGLADRAGCADPAPAPAAPPAAPTLADRALSLLEARAAQGLGGATYSWIAPLLGCSQLDLAEIIPRDPRFERVAAGTMVWWWSAQALRDRFKLPG